MGVRRWALGCVLVLGMTGAAVPAATAQNSVEQAKARQVLEYYQRCERTHRFAPCWTLLSSRVQAGWAEKGRGTIAEYAGARGADATRYTDFRVLQIRWSPSRIVFVVEAGGRGDRGPVRERVEYALLRDGEQWKVDGRRVGQSETAP